MVRRQREEGDAHVNRVHTTNGREGDYTERQEGNFVHV